MSPTGNDSEVDAPHTKRNRTGSETSQLLKGFASTAASDSTAPLEGQPGTLFVKLLKQEVRELLLRARPSPSK